MSYTITTIEQYEGGPYFCDNNPTRGGKTLCRTIVGSVITTACAVSLELVFKGA